MALTCPTCGAWTKVQETRTHQGKHVRRYACANYHTFKTTETITHLRKPDAKHLNACWIEINKGELAYAE